MEQRLSVEEAILRDEEEDQPVHDAQKLAVEVVQPDLPGTQGLAQRGVLQVAGEARAQDFERAFDTAAQLPERPRALTVRLAGPSFQPAGLGPVALARSEARGVGHEPEQHEIGVDLAREHRFEIEFEPGLAGEGLVVPQDAQAEAVRDDGPQVGVAAVEEFLHQPVRVGGRRAALSGGAAVQREAAAEEVDGRRPEEAADGVGAPADLGAGGGGQEAEPELAQQRQAPLVVGEAGARLARGQIRGGGAELRPVPAQAVPGLGDNLVQPLAGRERVVLRPGARQLRAGVDQAPQKVRWQQSAFGADRLEFLAVASAGHGGLVCLVRFRAAPAAGPAAGRRRPGRPRAARVRRRCGRGDGPGAADEIGQLAAGCASTRTLSMTSQEYCPQRDDESRGYEIRRRRIRPLGHVLTVSAMKKSTDHEADGLRLDGTSTRRVTIRRDRAMLN